MPDKKIHEELYAIGSYFNMWFLLGWYDIKQRYRRSFIGPFWITISTGVMVGSIGLVFSTIFRTPVSEFLPYFAVGQILWLFISTQISESCTTFIKYQSIIKQMSVPLSVHIMRRLWNNLILFFHNSLIIGAILILIGKGVSWKILLAFPAMLLSVILLFLISVTLGIICSRFRDITQVIAVFLQLIFFFTPILWMKKVLPADLSWITDLNPFFHMIELMRSPFLGEFPENILWVYMLIYILMAAVAALFFLGRYKHRVAYWL
jgi:lipopolysaccharide transport system permease protein